MSYFFHPDVVVLLEARENCFLPEEAAKFNQFHRKDSMRLPAHHPA